MPPKSSSEFSTKELAIIARYAGLNLTNERLEELLPGFRLFQERVRRVEGIPAKEAIPAHITPLTKD